MVCIENFSTEGFAFFFKVLYSESSKHIVRNASANEGTFLSAINKPFFWCFTISEGPDTISNETTGTPSESDSTKTIGKPSYLLVSVTQYAFLIISNGVLVKGKNKICFAHGFETANFWSISLSF